MADFTFWSLKDYVTSKGGCNEFRIADCVNKTTNEPFKIAQFKTDRTLPDGRTEFIGIALSRKMSESGIVLDKKFIKDNAKELYVTMPEGSKIPVMFFKGEGTLDECEW